MAGPGLRFAGGSALRCEHRSSRVRRAAEDTMGELFTKYYRLQEVNRNLEAKLLQSPKSTQAKPGVSIPEQHILDAKADQSRSGL